MPDRPATSSRLAQVASLLRGKAASSLPNLDGLSILDALTPKSGYREVRDLTYGKAPHQQLDLYKPLGRKGPLPTVVFIHGGRWSSGHRRQYRFVGQALAQAGIGAAIVSYRVWPAGGFPYFVEDVALSLAFLSRGDGDEEIDTQRLFLAGHSAGAHIGALLATNTPWLADAGARRENIAGFIGLSGPYDFLPLTDPDLIEIFGPESGHPLSQPVLFVDGKEPPTLLLHGREDRTVGVRNSTALAKAINASGGEARVRTYAGLDHVKMVAALSTRLGPWLAPVLQDIVSFVHDTGARDRPQAMETAKVSLNDDSPSEY